MMIRNLVVFALLCAAAPAYAQPSGSYTLFDPVPEADLRDLATDRPNATNTPTTIDAGHLQIEGGAIDASIDRQDGDRMRTWRYGELNFRLGVLDRLELNMVVEPYQVERDSDARSGAHSRASGFGDLTVGGKLNLWGDGGNDATWSSGLAIQPQVKLPTAAHGLGNDHVEASIGLPFQMTLPAAFHLSVQPTLSTLRNAADDGYTTGYQGAIAIDHDVGPIDIYAEYVAQDTSERGQPDEQTLDLGFTLPVGHNLQLDSGANIGLDRAAVDFEWLSGITARF